MSKLRQRTKYYIYSGLIGALFMFMLSSIALYYIYNYSDEKKELEITELKKKVSETEALLEEQKKAKVAIYVLVNDIEAGKVIDKKDLKVIEVQQDLLPSNIAKPEEVLGKIAKIDLKKNTPLLSSMLFQEGITPDDMRRSEFSFITLPTKLKKNDYVDIRIFFPTGQDYIVLSKKKVMDFENGTVWHELNEEEILRMSSAVVDAYLNKAYIYSLVYVDPYMQQASTVTYPVNSEVLELMTFDPNVVNYAKKELEARMRKALDNHIDIYKEKYKVSQTQNEEIMTKRFGQKEYPQFTQDATGQKEVTESSIQDDNAEIFNEPATHGNGGW